MRTGKITITEGKLPLQNVRHCTQVSSSEMIVLLAQGRGLVNKGLVSTLLELAPVYLATVKKDGKEYEVYCA